MIELSVVGTNMPALVDECHADLRRYRWRLDKDGYVMRKSAGKRIYLHHVVLPGDHYPRLLRDHINRDKMDNQLANLRWLPFGASAQNRDAYAKNPLGLRGVKKIGARFRATVKLDGIIHRLGVFDDPQAAAAAAAAWRARHMPFSSDAAA